MNKKLFIIFPNQLFNIKYIKSFLNKNNFDKNDFLFLLLEHPYYFTRYNFNKKKLILHRSSMKMYYDYMKSKKYDIRYIEYTEFNKKDSLDSLDSLDKYDVIRNDVYMFDPIDKIKEFEKYTNKIESPNFLLTKDMYEEYHNKTDKFFFYFFYMWSKEKLNIIPSIKSKDKENRQKITSNVDIPLSIPKKLNSVLEKEYIDEAIEYIEKHFSKNCGDTTDFFYPITEKSAKKLLQNFIKTKFKNFGKYQDTFIDNNDNDNDNDNTFALFHSVLSSSINIGLINPSDIINIIKKYKKNIPINSYEGYIRQLFWREYQRYTYIYADFSGNYFKNTKKLTKDWYLGTVGIPPVDNCIKKGFHYAYLHHIERLMVIGNYMNISGISPEEGLKWFMEFSIDSYTWVMYCNVYDMVFYKTGGKTTRKPYISSSNYILKMSDYKKGEWSEKWDKKYWSFRKKNRGKRLF